MMVKRPKMRGLLIDLDGTLYHGTHRIEGADTLISYLKDIGLPYRFVTNNSSASPEDVADRLTTMGITASPDDVCTSAQAAAQHIADLQPCAKVFVVGEEGLRTACTQAGLELVEEQPDFVLQGIDRSFTYERLTKAVRYIHSGAPYVLTNPDLLIPSGEGLIPGAGSIGAMLKAAGGKEPTLIGKPSPILMKFSLNSIGLSADETWVIGDNMATDIAFGHNSGCGTVLVLTGLTTADNLDYYVEQAGCKPDMICNHLEELRAFISDYSGM